MRPGAITSSPWSMTNDTPRMRDNSAVFPNAASGRGRTAVMWPSFTTTADDNILRYGLVYFCCQTEICACIDKTGRLHATAYSPPAGISPVGVTTLVLANAYSRSSSQPHCFPEERNSFSRRNAVSRAGWKFRGSAALSFSSTAAGWRSTTPSWCNRFANMATVAPKSNVAIEPRILQSNIE